MIWVLIRKDARLLRYYLRSAVAATVACYLFGGLMVVILTSYQDVQMQGFTPRALLTLSGGSNVGVIVTAFLAALLAGSVFTLERIDRSAEFLACLPPTRMQSLVSKLTVVFGAVSAMLAIHFITLLASHQLLSYVRNQSGILASMSLPNALTATTMLAAIISMMGGALAVSAWLNSNGVPILCGLLTPFLVMSLVSLLGWAMDIPSEGDAFTIRYATSSLVLGLAFAFMGCYWYLIRSEP